MAEAGEAAPARAFYRTKANAAPMINHHHGF